MKKSDDINRKNLVLVRAGDRSLHPQWISNDRNWDLVVSYYGDFPERYTDQYDIFHSFKGSKWEGVVNFISNNYDHIKDYDYIWIPDDDLFCNSEIINNFFDLCKLFNFTIAQPALTPYSYFSWPITIQVEKSIARQTNFVEIMAPCFNIKHLHYFSKYFGENTSGWGFEWLWEKIAKEEDIFNIGIIDHTPVFHTRMVGSDGHGGSKKLPAIEAKELFENLMESGTSTAV